MYYLRLAKPSSGFYDWKEILFISTMKTDFNNKYGDTPPFLGYTLYNANLFFSAAKIPFEGSVYLKPRVKNLGRVFLSNYLEQVGEDSFNTNHLEYLRSLEEALVGLEKRYRWIRLNKKIFADPQPPKIESFINDVRAYTFRKYLLDAAKILPQMSVHITDF